MSAALSVFKLSVQSVCQLQQRTIEVSFDSKWHVTALSVNSCGKSFHAYRQQGSLQLGIVGWFWRVTMASQYHTPHDNPVDWIWRLKYHRGYL